MEAPESELPILIDVTTNLCCPLLPKVKVSLTGFIDVAIGIYQVCLSSLHHQLPES